MIEFTTQKITTVNDGYVFDNGELVELVEKKLTSSFVRGIDVVNKLTNLSELNKQKDLYDLIKTLSEKNYPINQYYRDLDGLFRIINTNSMISDTNYVICNGNLSIDLESHPSYVRIINSYTVRGNGNIYLSGQINLPNRTISVITNPYLSFSDTTLLFGSSNEIYYIEKSNKETTFRSGQFILTESYNFVNNQSSYLRFKKINVIHI